jgi:collagenase-like PrtC family protease
MQLVAYGAQDIYLTGNPQITFWKVSYKRHTNFSMESIEQTFNGAADWGRKVTCTISRNGDLISRVYLQVTLPRVTAAYNQ